VGPSLHLSGLQRKKWGRPVKRLDLRLDVDAEDHAMGGRIEVQPHDVADLVDEQRIGRELEGLGPVRL